MPRRKSFETFYPRYWRVYLATCPLAGLLYVAVTALTLALDANSAYGWLAAFTCFWIPCQQMLVLILMMNYRISIDDRGIGEYNIFNVSRQVSWDSVTSAYIHYLAGFPVLIIIGYFSYQRVRIPLFMYKSDRIAEAFADFAGPDHPVALATVERYRDAD